MSNVYLKIPTINELHYRQKWMKDKKTMNYNAGYDIEYDEEKGIWRTNKIIVTNPRIITNEMVIELYKKQHYLIR